MTHDLVWLFDVDNTLLDNDAVYAGLRARIEAAVGEGPATRFWDLYAEVRSAHDVVDIPATIKRFEQEFPGLPGAHKLHSAVFDFPFSQAVYQASPAAVTHAGGLGLTAILTDGDPVFQPHKIESAGLRDLFDGRIILCEHKELEFETVRQRYPAGHYVMIDDKPRIHRALKQRYGSEITTVMIRQGHYAVIDRDYRGADLVLNNIEEVTRLQPGDLQIVTAGA